MSPASAITRRTLADSRIRTISFAALFAVYAFIQAIAYRDSYRTIGERRAFALAFGNDKAVRLFYGVPHDLLTTSGYAAWRVGGVLAIFSAIWGVLAAVRCMRAEEDSGRQELVMAGAISRGRLAAAMLTALAAEMVMLWAALFAGLAAARLPIAGSAYLALATIAPIPVFVGVGALASQLLGTRRQAFAASLGAVVVSLALRAVADTASAGWLRWLTPLGWSELLRPFAGPSPAVLLLGVGTAALLLWAAIGISLRRDVGSGLIETPDAAAPRMSLLSSPTAYALRSERAGLVGWVAGFASAALVVGLLANSFTRTSLPPALRREIQKLGGAALTTPSGALATYFLIFVLATALFACSQVAAARREEAEQRLETLLALPVGRRSWLLGRLLLAAAGAAGLGLVAGFVAWAAAASQGAAVSLPGVLEAGLNCLPASLLFLALCALALAVWPRGSGGLGYGLVAVAFLWDLVGALLGAPSWTLSLSPFRHVAFVPVQPFAVTDAVGMLAIAVLATVLAVAVFERRDLVAE